MLGYNFCLVVNFGLGLNLVVEFRLVLQLGLGVMFRVGIRRLGMC